MLPKSTMGMRISSYASVAFTLLAMVIVTAVGVAAPQPKYYGAYEDTESEVPWNHGLEYGNEMSGQSEWRDPKDPEMLLQQLADLERLRDEHSNQFYASGRSNNYYSQPGDWQYGPKIYSDPRQEFFEPMDYPPQMNMNEQANWNPASDRDFKRMIRLPWRKGQTEKFNYDSNINNQFCPIAQGPTKRPGSQDSTTERRFSTICLTTAAPPTPPPPTAPPRTPPPPSAPAPESAPKEGQPSQCRKKAKTPILDTNLAKMILDTIMDTKKHTLLTLEILNHLEDEVLVHSADTCPLPNEEPLEPNEEPLEPNEMHQTPPTPSPQGFCRKVSDGARASILTLMKEQKQHSRKDSIDPVASWCPKLTQAARQVGETLDDTLQPMDKYKYNKRRYYGQKQQKRMMNVPPGMVAIMC